MSRITNLFSKHWRNLHFALIVSLSVLLIVGNSFVTPYVNQVALAIFYLPFAKAKNSVMELHGVATENRRLRQALVEASITISMLEESNRENSRLRSVLGFVPPPGYTLLPAEVISVAGDYIPTSAIISRGANDSIFVNQPVINQQGLIGRISAVTEDFATVQLLTDPTNRVAARLATSREMGIIKYSTIDGMVLDNFPVQGTANVGDTVLSSGLGGVYPGGLTVGVVSDVTHPEHEPFCDIKVTPTVNFHSLDELFVLRTQTE